MERRRIIQTVMLVVLLLAATMVFEWLAGQYEALREPLRRAKEKKPPPAGEVSAPPSRP